MLPETRARLWDARDAAQMAKSFVGSRGYSDYEADAMLRAAVERQFTIVGEALAQVRRLDPAAADQVPDLPQIVAFRNVLVHGYADVDEATVWHAATVQVSGLIATLTRLIDEDQE